MFSRVPIRRLGQRPVRPGERDGVIYGRGCSDDKGQVFVHVKSRRVAAEG